MNKQAMIDLGLTEEQINVLLSNDNNELSATIENDIMVIRIPFNDERDNLSSSGKTYLHASTGGFKQTSIKIDGQTVKINVTAITSV